MKNKILLSILLFLLSFSDVKSQTGGFDLSKYQMIFNDEFNGTTVDWVKWGLGETWTNSPGAPFFNTKDNCTEANGIIRFRGDQKGSDGKYHTGGIYSIDKFGYGYFESRFKIPKGQGLWPAFWLLNYYDNPEIDIMENLGNNTKVMYCTLQELSDNNNQFATSGSVDYSLDFHVFGCAWYADSITMYIDNKRFCNLVQEKKSNLDAMGDYCYDECDPEFADRRKVAGIPDNTTSFPAYFDIDYLRVYKPNKVTSVDEAELNTNVSLYPNPVTDVIHIGTTEEADVFIYDLKGVVKLQKKIGDNESGINVSTLEKGIYFIMIRKDNGSTLEKFVKE